MNRIAARNRRPVTTHRSGVAVRGLFRCGGHANRAARGWGQTILLPGLPRVLATVLLGWLPIAIAAIIGGTLMVLSGCLTMEEAYRYIEWPAVFLIAAMLPLGIALQTSGAATFLTDSMIDLIGDAGPLAVLAGLFVLSVLASQVMPNAAVVVLMAPIAIASAADMNVSPYTFMMGIAISASASFMSPISHPANILVMGPGGYRFSDFIKIGLPLTVIVLVIVLILLPKVWPF